MGLRFDREPNVWPVFTDVMMGTIFIFLILVIATNNSLERKKIYDEIERRKADLAKELIAISHEEKYITKQNTAAFIVDKSNDQKLTLIFNSSMLFDKGDHKLKQNDRIAEPIIDDISSVLQSFQTSNKHGFHEVIIEGHTDDTRFKHYFDYGNWGLSADRANEVLMKVGRKINGRYLSPRGYANMRPRMDQDGKPLNEEEQRRIEITIVFNPDSVRAEQSKLRHDS